MEDQEEIGTNETWEPTNLAYIRNNHPNLPVEDLIELARLLTS